MKLINAEKRLIKFIRENNISIEEIFQAIKLQAEDMKEYCMNKNPQDLDMAKEYAKLINKAEEIIYDPNY